MPNHLLIGHATMKLVKEDASLELETTGHWLTYLVTLEKNWWEKFWNEVFEGLLQFPKGWNKLVENLQVGNIVMIHYDVKSQLGNWR